MLWKATQGFGVILAIHMGLYWNKLDQIRIWCEYGNKPTGSKNNWRFLDKLSGYQFTEQDSIPRC